MKEFLSHAGYEFAVRDVEEDLAAYRELTALGVRTIPATVIGDHVIRGYDPAGLRTALAAAGGESSPDL